MPIQIVRKNITKIKVDAIVNPTDKHFSGRGGVDKQINDAAGPKLKVECLNCKTKITTGEAIITDSCNLKNTKYVIHTIGPIYKDGKSNEEKYLTNCYKNILRIAKDNDIKSLAIPLISSGTFGYPKKDALKIASEVIMDFLYENEMNIYLLVYDDEAYDLAKRIFRGIENYLTNEELNESFTEEKVSNNYLNNSSRRDDIRSFSDISKPKVKEIKEAESFAECLLRMIKERNLVDSKVYSNALVSRQTFNKIINVGSIPKKENVLALAISMKLNIKDTEELVEKAGYSFGVSKYDRIVIDFMERDDYKKIDARELNEWLKESKIN